MKNVRNEYRKPDEIWTSHLELFMGRLAADIQKKLEDNNTIKHQNCDLAADIPKNREDNKTTQHQNCDLAAAIPKKSKLKPSNL